MKDIFLSGIQGSGKGTQADMILKAFPNKFKYFETGSILRALTSTDNAIGNYIKSTLETGGLVKDEVTVAVFNVFLQTVENNDRLLLDGVLRKLGQTQAICEKMKEVGRDFIVLNFDLNDDMVYQRLASRIVCSKCGNNSHNGVLGGKCENCGGELIRRNDDSNIEAIKTRIEAFHRDTIPGLQRIEEQGKLIHVDANRPVEEIFADVMKYIKE